MAHGNMLLGYSRGSVGDVTFTRTNGQQIARARNRRPKNPRSNSQMAQRSLFASAVKMYQLAVANFFKFAYEDRKTHESDYNAFMRHNVKQGTNISKACFNDRKYPAIGNWVFGQGSLQELDYVQQNNNVKWYTGVKLPEADYPRITTIGQLSSYLLLSDRYKLGDMITVVEYGWYPYGSEVFPSLEPPISDHGTYFDFSQFIIDPNDDTRIDTYGWSSLVANVEDTHPLEVFVEIGSEIFDEQYRSVAIIHTRKKSDGGIMSSNAPLLLSGAYEQAYIDSSSPEYIDSVLASWKSSEDAILNPDSGAQGSSTSVFAQPVDKFPMTIAANTSEAMLNLYGIELAQGDKLRMLVKRDSNQSFYSNVIYQDGATIDASYFQLVSTSAAEGGNKTITLKNASTGSHQVTISSLQVNGKDVPILTL